MKILRNYVIFKLDRMHKKYIKKQKKHIKKTNCILSIYFGVPGSGKTTFASYLANKELKHGCNVWSNVPISGAIKLDVKSDIGIHEIHDGRIIIDEAGIEYDSREHKTFSKESTYFFKYHRHYNCPVDLFSQGWEDCDKKLRVLAQRYYVIKKSIIPFFIVRKTIGKKIDIDKVSGQIIDRYYFRPLGIKYIFSPVLWGLFNTHSRKKLIDKEWQRW